MALVDDADYELVVQYRWWADGAAGKNLVLYARGRLGSTHQSPMVSMHKLITGWPQTDHEDHDGLNNQRYNLRDASRSQNTANQRPIRGGTSRYKGVVHNRHGTWTSRIKFGGSAVYLGNFGTELDAALAYDVAARRHFGEFACPNFPEGFRAMVEFRMDGPYSPEETNRKADLFAEGIRYLNHATRPGAGGLEYPADAYALLGNWAHAAGMMPQLAEQAGVFLAGQAARAGLYDARGDDPADRIVSAREALNRAEAAAWTLCRALQDAQNAIAGVGVRDDDDDVR